MSLLAGIMEALKYTDQQNHMIIHGVLSNTLLAEQFGKSVRQIQRQRAFLKSQMKSQISSQVKP